MMNQKMDDFLKGDPEKQEFNERLDQIGTYQEANWSEKLIEGLDYHREEYIKYESKYMNEKDSKKNKDKVNDYDG